MPFVATRSFTPYGIPCSGPRSLPAKSSWFARCASRIARSRVTAHQGAEARAERLEPAQAELGELDGAEPARAQLRADLADAGEEHVLRDHRVTPGRRAAVRRAGAPRSGSRGRPRSRAARRPAGAPRQRGCARAPGAPPRAPPRRGGLRTAGGSASASASSTDALAPAAAGAAAGGAGLCGPSAPGDDRRHGQRLQESASRLHAHLRVEPTIRQRLGPRQWPAPPASGARVV